MRVASSSSFVKYIDPATIRKDNNLHRVWEFDDNDQPDRIGRLSARLRAEYYCNEEATRFLSFAAVCLRCQMIGSIY